MIKKFLFFGLFFFFLSSFVVADQTYYDDASVDLVSTNFELNTCSGGVLFAFNTDNYISSSTTSKTHCMSQKAVNASGDTIGVNITFKQSILSGTGGQIVIAIGEGSGYAGSNLEDGYHISFAQGTTTEFTVIHATGGGATRVQLGPAVTVPSISAGYQTISFWKEDQQVLVRWDDGSIVFNETDGKYNVSANTIFKVAVATGSSNYGRLLIKDMYLIQNHTLPPPPIINLNVSLESDFSFLQVGSVNVNSGSFSDILSGSFNVSVDGTESYFSAAIPISRGGGGSADISCRLLINGSDFGSEFGRSITGGTSGSMYITTVNVSLPIGGYIVQSQCARTSGLGNVKVSGSNIIGHLLVDELGNRLNHGFLNVSSVFNSNSLVLLDSLIFSTSDLIRDGVHNTSIVVDWNAVYNYTSPGIINSMVAIGGVNCSLYPRDNGVNTLGSVGGDCVLLNAGFNNSYNISFFGLGNGSITSNVHVKEFITNPRTVNNKSLNGTNIVSSSFAKLLNFTVEDVDHVIIDLFVKAGVPHISNSGSTTSSFFLSINGGLANSTIITQTASSSDKVTTLSFLFENVSSINSVELWGGCDNSDCSITGGDLSAYFVNPITEVLISFNANASQFYNNVLINNFNVTTSNGNVFSTSIGSVTVDSNFNFDNFTARSNSFFPKTVFNHNSFKDIQINFSQAFINFNIFEKVTGSQLSFFSVNDSFQSNTTSNGNATLSLLAGNDQTISFQNDLGYFNNTFLVDVSVLDNLTFNVSNAVNILLNLSVFNILNGFPINNFSGVITASDFSFSESFNSSSGTINISLNQNNNYFVELDVISGFSTFNNNLTISSFETNTSFLNKNISLFTNNSISFNIFNISDSSLIFKTVDVELLGLTITVNLNTSNGSIFVDNLNDDTYSISISSVGFSDSKLIATVNNNAHLEVDVFMISGDNKIFRIIDTFSNNVANATVTILQVINGSTITVGEGVSGFDGRVIFDLDDSKTYSLIVSALGFDIFTGDIQPVLNNYDIVIFETALSPFISVWDDISIATLFSYSPNSSVANVSLIINSNKGSLQFYGLDITYNTTIFFVNTSGSPGGGIESLIVTGVNPLLNNSLLVKYFFKRSGSDVIFWNETFFLEVVTPSNISLFNGLFFEVQNIPLNSPVRGLVGSVIIILLVLFIGSVSNNMSLSGIVGLAGLAVNYKLGLASTNLLIASMVVILAFIIADNVLESGS